MNLPSRLHFVNVRLVCVPLITAVERTPFEHSFGASVARLPAKTAIANTCPYPEIRLRDVALSGAVSVSVRREVYVRFSGAVRDSERCSTDHRKGLRGPNLGSYRTSRCTERNRVGGARRARTSSYRCSHVNHRSLRPAKKRAALERFDAQLVRMCVVCVRAGLFSQRRAKRASRISGNRGCSTPLVSLSAPDSP